MIFKIKFQEILRREVEVEANSLTEAEELAVHMYTRGEVVLGPEDFVGEADISVTEAKEEQ